MDILTVNPDFVKTSTTERTQMDCLPGDALAEHDGAVDMVNPVKDNDWQ